MNESVWWRNFWPISEKYHHYVEVSVNVNLKALESVKKHLIHCETPVGQRTPAEGGGPSHKHRTHLRSHSEKKKGGHFWLWSEWSHLNTHSGPVGWVHTFTKSHPHVIRSPRTDVKTRSGVSGALLSGTRGFVENQAFPCCSGKWLGVIKQEMKKGGERLHLLDSKPTSHRWSPVALPRGWKPFKPVLHYPRRGKRHFLEP